MNDSSWKPLEGDVDELLNVNNNPMGALAAGEIPAIILRNAFPSELCSQLVARFYERDLVPGLPKPGEPITGKLDFERIDIGTSLGMIGDDQNHFFAHTEKTTQIYKSLFAGMENPVHQLYDTITRLSPGKQAVTAYEPDGRRYGAAIIRCHMPHWGYAPHIDSVRIREVRTNYAVHRFNTQLGGILLIQAPENKPTGFDSIIHRCEWSENMDQELENHMVRRGDYDKEAFYAYAEKRQIASCGVSISEGDIYFFNSHRLHEAPFFTGNRPRIVLAVFFGYTDDDPEIFVWS